MALFPLIDTPDQGAAPDPGLPLYREVAWDYTRDRPLWRGGEPVLCSGRAAVLVWIHNCLRTRRFSTDVFSPDYGQDFDAMVGRPVSAALRESEAIRSLREALLINPYITAVRQISCQAQGSTLRLRFTADTVYGEVSYDDTL